MKQHKNHFSPRVIIILMSTIFILCGVTLYMILGAKDFVIPIILIIAMALLTVGAVIVQIFFTKKVYGRYHWYESLLDAIPFPISVTDIDMNWTFINKPVEDMLGIKRSEILGKQCHNWNANICNTENCGIARLRSGQLQTQFKQLGMDFQVDTSYIRDKKGNQAGHIEVVQDITSKVRGAQYSNQEVAKIAANLKALSEGSLNMDFSVGAGDQYTAEEKKNFEEINQNFKMAVDNIAVYISEISYILGEIADGNVSRSIVSEFKGDFLELKTALNHIVSSLNDTMLNINSASQQVAAGTRQVSDGSQAISQGATEQASAIEQLTSTVAQIAGQTRQNAVNANRANELAISAKDHAVDGNEQMKGMQSAMVEINESSANISKIIKVIDGIAFQTNILALNAAVEAARAGVHGKGFAVVAEEVRNLAARSAQAAKETTVLIESSIKKTEAGTEIANKTAAALAIIVEGVEKAAELMGQIAAASDEQATGIMLINGGIEQLSQVVQNNSATSEETAASAEELSSQAEILNSMVGRFKMEEAAQSARLLKGSPEHGHIENKVKRPEIELNDSQFGKY